MAAFVQERAVTPARRHWHRRLDCWETHPNRRTKDWRKVMGLNKAPEDNLVPEVLDRVIEGMDSVEWNP